MTKTEIRQFYFLKEEAMERYFVALNSCEKTDEDRRRLQDVVNVYRTIESVLNIKQDY